jgi:peptidoglycan/LPS O-acetylase OafA/YrhL
VKLDCDSQFRYQDRITLPKVKHSCRILEFDHLGDPRTASLDPNVRYGEDWTMVRSSSLSTHSVEGLGTQYGNTRSFYKPELDMLRFFAFLAVFFFHTVDYSTDFLVQHHLPLWAAKSALGVAHAGAYGVDLFFVLSAYLITELLLREKDVTGTLNVRAFYLRRILRIWPLYYLFIALAALIPFLNPHHEFSLRYVLAFIVLMGNWSFVLFGLPNFVAVPLWSVAVEEQFYLCWPPVVARLSRRQIMFAAITMICVANIARPLAVAMHQSGIQLWMNSFAHLDSIAAGILLAVLWNGNVLSFKYGIRVALIAFGMGFLAIVAYFTNQDGRLSLPAMLIGSPWVVLACTAILIGFINLPFRSPVLQYLGKISYGLYVYHVTGIYITDNLLPGGGEGAVHACARLLLALGITVATSAVSYQVVEKPFLDLKRRFTYVSSRPV